MDRSRCTTQQMGFDSGKGRRDPGECHGADFGQTQGAAGSVSPLPISDDHRIEQFLFHSVDARPVRRERGPERFAHWHFHVPVWRTQLVDIAASPKTSQSTLDAFERLSAFIGQRAVRGKG